MQIERKKKREKKIKKKIEIPKTNLDLEEINTSCERLLLIVFFNTNEFPLKKKKKQFNSKEREKPVLLGAIFQPWNSRSEKNTYNPGGIFFFF